MFVLAHIKDVARVMPSHFSEERLKRIELEINKKYANKVPSPFRNCPSPMCLDWMRAWPPVCTWWGTC